MKTVSNAYKKAMEQIIREQAFISVVLAEVNGVAQEEARFDSNGSYWSDSYTPFNTDEQGTEYATFEQNFAYADGKMLIMPRPNTDSISNVGFCTENILEAVTISFGAAYAIKGLTIDFGEGYPTEFVITTDLNTTGTTYTNNSEVFETTDTLGDISTLTITPTTMVGGNQRLRIKRILMGIGLSYGNDSVSKAELSEEISGISENIPDTTLNIKVLDNENLYNVNNTDSFIDYLTTGQTVTLSFGVALDEDSNEIEWIKTQTLYLNEWSSKKGEFTFTANNIFASETDTYTLGNRMYTRTAYAEAESILTDMGLEPDDYVIDNYLKSITLTNPMPEDTHPNCLLLLCNACRCIYFQDSEGIVHIQANFALNLEPEDIDLTVVGETAYSHPRNVLTDGAVMTHYADFTYNFSPADGSMLILPQDSSDYDDYTGYVSKQIADYKGDYFNNMLIPPYVIGDSYTMNGITFTTNSDGSITLNGTCTAQISMNIYKATDLDVTEGKTYFLCGCPLGGSWSTSGHNTYTLYTQSVNRFDTGGGIMFTWNRSMSGIGIAVANGQVLNNVTFKPTLICLDDCDFKLYENYLMTPYYDADNSFNTNTYIPVGSFIRKGLNVECKENGEIIVNGTANDVANLVMLRTNPNNKFVKLDSNYMLKECGELINGVSLRFSHRTSANATVGTDVIIGYTTTGLQKTFTTEDVTNWNKSIVFYQINSGTVCNDLHLKPMLVCLDDMESVPTEYINSPRPFVIGKKPQLTMALEAGYVYYGINMNFTGNPPKEVQVDTSYNGNHVDTYTFYDLQKENYLSAEFRLFDSMTITFNKSEPNSRVVLDYIGLGNITDYMLDKDNMTSFLEGTREELVKDIRVKIYTYELDENNEPQEVEDDVWYTLTLNTTGSHKEIKNPLISDTTIAQDLAEWLGTYFNNNFTYEVNYRGDPRLNAADIIKLEDDYINNLQVAIETSKLEFNGAFKGSLSMRRAMRE